MPTRPEDVTERMEPAEGKPRGTADEEGAVRERKAPEGEATERERQEDAAGGDREIG